MVVARVLGKPRHFVGSGNAALSVLQEFLEVSGFLGRLDREHHSGAVEWWKWSKKKVFYEVCNREEVKRQEAEG
jgi:hypothetical protein